MNFAIGQRNLNKAERIWLTTLHWLVLFASGTLILWIAHDTLLGEEFLTDTRYRRFQTFTCFLFQIDIITEWRLAQKKWKFIFRNLIFILVSIPYLDIIELLGTNLNEHTLFALCFVPMIRAAFVFAVVTGALTANRALSTFYVYLIWVIASLMFASLMFYELEHFVNDKVDTYWSALWWSFMALSTAGCYITPTTTAGNVIQFFLSAEGLVLIPVFTVYVTRAITWRQSPQTQEGN